MKKEAVRVLGMVWNVVQDCFSFDCLNSEVPLKLNYTKRAVLSCITRLFDPLGFISPFIMYVKILFQDMWKAGSGWDEVLPDELYKFQKWFNDISQFKSWKVQR